MDVNNKTVWITGASSGIGKELALQLSKKGARLILSARNREALEALKDELGGDNHQVLVLDLSEPEALLEKLAPEIKSLGPIDILINNGGISQRSLFADSDFSVFRRLMEVNYLGTVALAKLVVPDMLKRGSGMIVSVSSVAGKVGSKYRSGYSGSKFAVVGFMDCLRAELADTGVHCLTLCPGSVKTAIAHNSLNENGVAQNKPEESIENGMTVEEAVRKMIHAIEQEKDEVVIGKGLSGWAPTIKRFFPGFFNRLTAKVHYR